MNERHHWDARRTAARAATRLAAAPAARAIPERPARRCGVEAERGGEAAPAPEPAPGDAEAPAAAPALPARGSLFRPLSLWPDPRHAPPWHARR